MIIGQIFRYCPDCNKREHNVTEGGKIECVKLYGDRQRRTRKPSGSSQVQLPREAIGC